MSMIRRLLTCGWLLVLLFSVPSPVLAHAYGELTQNNWWQAWNWDLPLLVLLGLVGWRYTAGVWSLWERAGFNRGIQFWRVAAFWIGWEALFIALISPLDALSYSLLSAHMVQHMLLMLVAAPLMVLGAPPVALAWAVPHRWRQGLARWWHRRATIQALWNFLTRPIVVWGLFAAVLWVWHIPGLYEAALRYEAIHVLEHACFFIVSLLFWWMTCQKRLGYGGAVIFIFTTSIHSGLLGVFMTFAATLWYPEYVTLTEAWGLTPLEDQQLAGIIMWVVGGMIYTIPALALVWQWLASMERVEQAYQIRWAEKTKAKTT